MQDFGSYKPAVMCSARTDFRIYFFTIYSPPLRLAHGENTAAIVASETQIYSDAVHTLYREKDSRFVTNPESFHIGSVMPFTLNSMNPIQICGIFVWGKERIGEQQPFA